MLVVTKIQVLPGVLIIYCCVTVATNFSALNNTHFLSQGSVSGKSWHDLAGSSAQCLRKLKSWCWLGSSGGSPGGKCTFNLIQVVGRIHPVVNDGVLAVCWQSAEGHPRGPRDHLQLQSGHLLHQTWKESLSLQLVKTDPPPFLFSVSCEHHFTARKSCSNHPV